MKFLQGLALSLLSFLLFLSLALFGMAFSLNSTLLNPDFAVAQVDRLDVSALVRELTAEQVSQLPPEAGFLEEALYTTIEDNEPWLKEQVTAGIYSFYDYLLGQSERLSLVVSLEPLKANLRDNMWQTFMQAIPPELSGLPQAQIEQYFDEYYRQFAEQIPSSFEVDESSIPPEIMAQIIQVREGIGYYQLGYKLLIGFMVLLVLGIVLINRNVKSTARGLGVPLLTYGAFEYAGIWATRYFAPTYLTMVELPPSLQTWVSQLFDDFLAPLEMFSLGLLAAGVVLLIVSFVYRRRRVEEVESI